MLYYKTSKRYKDMAMDVLPLRMFEKSDFRELESF